MKFRFLLPVLLLICTLSACSVNPVTGERNFQLYDSSWENQIGQQMYAPMKQAEGGEFLLDPELTQYVQQVGQRLARQARRQTEFDYEFGVLNSSVPNAWALPGGKIVVNRGLLTALDSEAELAAVLGHEIVHADAAHGARAQSKGVLTQAGAMVGMVLLGSTLDSQAAREVGMMVPALGAQMLNQKYGRDNERESDKYGMLYMSEAGYNPQGAVELQRTFLKISEGHDPDWVSGLFASHPPSRERLRNNQQEAENLPAGGETGRERYRSKMAYLKRVQPAYDALDRANKALQEDDIPVAQKELNKALAIEPRESLFHDLQGDIYALGKDYRKALASYQTAVRANPGYFYGHLRQGQMEYQLERTTAASGSLEKSLQLMPTAEAHYLLGMLAKNSGQTQKAAEHFQAAAGSETQTGQKAQRELVLMDLERNPGNYIASRAVVDNSNRVWVQMANRTSVDIRNIEISYAWLDEQGRTRNSSTRYPNTLGAGQQDQLRLSITLDNPAELSRRVRVEISGAQVAESDR